MRSICCFLVISLLSLWVFPPQLALAETEPTSQAASGVDLDLGSTNRNLSAASALGSASQAVINVGGAVRTVSGTDLLTAAEMVAVRQVVNAGRQYLNLNDMGAAIGGGLRLNPGLMAGVNSLVIPEGVRASQNAAILQNLNLSGALTNSGTFNVFSSNPAINAASVNAASIYNNAGALISANLANFSLNAINNIVNAGVIRSTGNLSLTAGGSISNIGQLAAMQALGNVNLNSAIGNIVNSGLISSLSSNINIASHMAANLTVNNIAGRFEALNGMINVRDVLYSGKTNATLLGGNWLSKELNIWSGNGIARANVQDLTGTVNIYAGEAHVSASTSNLLLGNMVITGDPTYYNNAGSVTIGGALSFAGQALAIVASQDIYTVAGAGAISTANGAGNGGAITMIAGAEFTTDDLSSSGSNNTTTTLTITGPSTTGGAIDLTQAGGITSLTSASTGGGGGGGSIKLVAFDGDGSGSPLGLTPGTITTPVGVTIESGGNGAGSQGGNVSIIAGAAAGTSVNVDSIDSAGGGVGGSIGIYTATPTGMSVLDPVTVLDGVVTGTIDPGIIQAAAASVGDLTSAGGAIEIITGTDIATGVLSSATSVNGATGGAISLTAGSGSILTGSVDSANHTGGGGGGAITFSSATTMTTGDIDSSALGGAGGGVSLTADGVLDAGNIYSSGNGGPGGTVTLAGSPVLLAGKTIDAGDGFVNLYPTTPMAVNVSGVAESGVTFDITATDLANITASLVTIGDDVSSTSVTLAGNVDVSFAAGSPGAFDLSLVSAGDYSSAGNSITLGQRNLTIYSFGNGSTDEISGENNTITITALGSLTLNARITATNGSLTDDRDGTIILSGSPVLFNLPGGHVINAGVLTGSVTLNPSTPLDVNIGGVAESGVTFDITTSDLTKITARTLNIGDLTNTSIVRMASNLDFDAPLVGFASLNVLSAGNFDYNGFTWDLFATALTITAGANISAGQITGLTNTLSMQAGGVLTLNGSITNIANVTLAGSPVVFNGNIVNAGTGTVTLRPTTALAVNVGGLAESGVTFDITAGDLASITASNVAIGDAITASSLSVVGNLDLNGPTGNFNLTLTSFGDFTSSGQTIDNGSLHTLTISTYGNATTGAIVGSEGSVYVTAAASLTLNGGMDLSNGGLVNGVINLKGSPVVLNGNTINAGDSGFVALAPTSDLNLAVNDSTGVAAPFDLTPADLASITTGTLQIGDIFHTLTLTVSEDMDISGVGAGAYDLVLISAGDVVTTGRTITIGTNNIAISENGGISNLATGNLDVSYLFEGNANWRPKYSSDFVLNAGGAISANYATATNSLIDLSNASGVEGQITVQAGADFTYTPLGVDITFTGGGASASGGDVNLNNVNFRTTNGDVLMRAWSGGSFGGGLSVGAVNATGTTSDVVLTASGGMSIGSTTVSRATGNFTATAGGGVSVNGTVFANNINLITNANDGNVNVGGSMYANAQITITTDGLGTVSFNVFPSAIIEAPLIEITTNDTSVTVFEGVQIVTPVSLTTAGLISITTGTLNNDGKISAPGTGGIVSIASNAADLNINPFFGTFGTIEVDPTSGSISLLNAAGNVTVSQWELRGPVAALADGNISITVGHGLLTTASIGAGGDITVQNSATNGVIEVTENIGSNGATGNINLVTGASGTILVPVASGVLAADALNITSLYIHNDGLLSAANGDVTIDNTGDVILVGSGTVQATGILQINVPTGNAAVNQGSLLITGVGFIFDQMLWVYAPDFNGGAPMHFSPHFAQSSSIYVLNDGATAAGITIISDELSFGSIDGNAFVFIGDNPFVTNVTGFQTSGGNLYMGFTGTADIPVTGDIDTRAAAGNGGYAIITANNEFTGTNVITAGTAGGNGGFVSIITQGDLNVSGFIDAPGDTAGGGGSVLLRSYGGDINVASTNAIGGSNNGANGGGGYIYMNASSVITATSFIDSSAENSLTSDAEGTAGWISLVATTLDLTSVRANGAGKEGDGGSITLLASDTLTVSAFVDSAALGTQDAGSGGDVMIHGTNDINLLSVNAVGGSSQTENRNNGGNIVIQSETGTVTATGFLDSSASTFNTPVGGGSAGLLSVVAPVNITGNMSYRAEGRSAVIPEAGSPVGNGANIRIETNGAADIGFVSSSAESIAAASGTGNAGRIDVIVNGAVNAATFRATGGIDGGNGGDVSIVSATDDVNTSFLFTSAFVDSEGGVGDGGDISLRAAQGSINIGSFIDTASGVTGSGNGGSVTMFARDSISSNSYINASSGFTAGNGGNIRLSTSAANAPIDFDFSLDTAARGNGNGGVISVTTDGDIHTGTLAANGGSTTGHGGNITVVSASGDIQVGSVSSNTQAGNLSGAANGGDVLLSAAVGDVASIGAMSSNALGITGDAGNLTIEFSNAGGNFVIDGTVGSVTNGVTGSMGARAAGSGNGGAITVVNNGGSLNVSLNDVINVESNTGNDGSINFNYVQSGIPVVSNPASTVTVTGNNVGEMLGPVYATGVFVTLSVIANNTNLTLGNINATNGSITATLGSNGQDIFVISGATILANEGDLTIENDNVADGFITMGASSTLTAQTVGSTFGNVYIVMGPPPGSPVDGTAPANTTPVEINLGQIYFGSNGISDQAPQNTVTADGGRAIFNTDPLDDTHIHLGGGVQIFAIANPSGIPIITSLDLNQTAGVLNDPDAVNVIQTLLGLNLITGTLNVGPGNVITGSITITTPYIASTLTAENLPEDMVVTFQDFLIGDPLTVNLTGTSTTSQVIIGGTHQYISTGSPSNVALNITSNQAGPVLVISNTGTLATDGSLTITANGAISNAGILTAVNDLTVSCCASSFTVTGTGFVSVGGNFTVSTSAFANAGTVTGGGAGTALLQDCGAGMTISGGGIVSGFSTINVLPTLGTFINFTGSQTFDAGLSGNVTMTAGCAGQITVDANQTLTATANVLAMSAGTITVGSLAQITAPKTITLSLGTLDNSGTVSVTGVVGFLGNLTVQCNCGPGLNLNGNNSGALLANNTSVSNGIYVYGNAFPVFVNADYAMTTPGSGSVSISSDDSVTIANNADLTATTGNFSLTAPVLTVGTAAASGASISATGFSNYYLNSLVDNGSISSDANVNFTALVDSLAFSGTPETTIQANGSANIFVSATTVDFNSSYDFTTTNAFFFVNSTTMNVNNGVTLSSGPNTRANYTSATVNVGTSAGSGAALDSEYSLTVITDDFNNNGSVSSDNSISLQALSGTLNLQGTPSSAVTTTILSTISVFGTTVNLNTDYSFDTQGGSLLLSGTTTNIVNGVSLTMNNGSTINAATTTLNVGTTAGSGSAIVGSGSVILDVANLNNNGTISTTASGVNIVMLRNTGGALTLGGTPSAAISAGAGSSMFITGQTINFNSNYTFSTTGGTVDVTCNVADINIADGITLTTSNSTDLNIIVGFGTFNLGTPSGAGATISGSGSVTLGAAAVSLNGSISTTAAALSNPIVISSLAALDQVSNLTVSAPSGTITVGSSATFTVEDDVTLSAIGGASLSIYGTTVTNLGSVSGAADITLASDNVVNDGSVTAATALNITGVSLTVTGSGTLTGATINFTALGGDVSATQGQYVGLVTGTATGDFSVVAGSGSLSVGAVSSGGDVLFDTTSSGNNILVGDSVAAAGTVTFNTSEAGSVVNNGQVLSNIAVSAGGLVYNTSNNYVYISNGSNVVVETADGSLVTTIPVGSGAGAMAVNPDGTRVYVATSGGLTVIDATANTFLTTISMGAGLVSAAAVTPSGDRVYVSHSNGTVTVVNAVSNTVLTSISTGGGSGRGITVDPSGTYVFVASQFSPQAIYVISTATNTVVKQITMGGNMIDVAATQGAVYATSVLSNFVSVIDIPTLSVVGSIPIEGGAWGIKVNSAGTFGFVSTQPDASKGQAGNMVSIINLATKQVVSTITGLSTPVDIAINSAGTRIYVDNNGSSNVGILSSSLLSGTGIVFNAGSGTFDNVPTNVSTFSATTTGDLMIGNVGNMALGVLTVGGRLDVSAGGNISTTGAVSAQTVFMATTAANGAIDLDGNVTGSDSVSLSTIGTGAITQTSGTISSSGRLTLASTSGNFGAVGSELRTAVSSLAANTDGDVNVIQTGALTIVGSSAGGAFNVAANNDLTTAGPIAGNSINLQTTANNGDVTIGANITATTTATITAQGSGNITVVPNEGTSLAFTTTIPVGTAPTSVAFYPDSTFAFVANSGSASYSVIDTSTNQVIQTVAVPGGSPFSIAINPQGTRAYVGVSDGTIAVYDITLSSGQPTNGPPIAIITLPSATTGFGITVSPDGNSVYVSSNNFGTSTYAVTVINASNNTVSSFVPIPPVAPQVDATNPLTQISFDPDGDTYYVNNWFHKQITFIDASDNSILDTVYLIPSGGDGPVGGAISPNGNSLYTANISSNSVSVVDTGSGSVLANITVGNLPVGFSLSQSGAYGYVFNTGDATVSVIDTSSNEVVATIATPGALPFGIGAYATQVAGNNVVYVPNGNNISVLSAVAPAVTGATVSLNSTSGSIGTSTQAVATSAPVLSANTGGTANVYLSQAAGSMSLGNSTAGGSFNLTSGADIAVDGTVTAGSVNITTDTVLNVNNNVTATDGSATLTATGILNATAVLGALTITATVNVNMTGSVVTIGDLLGSTVLVSGGVVGGGRDPFSTNMNDYSLDQITSPGGVLITSSVGDLVLNDGVTIDSFGASIGLTSADNLTFGDTNDLFAQGANVWMQASNIIDMPAGTVITAVARYTSGTVTIDDVRMQNFQGGGLAIFAGTSLPDYNTYLKDTAVSGRTLDGVYNNFGADVTGTPMVIGGNIINGSWVQLEVPAGGTVNLLNSAVLVDGGVMSIDPPGIINLNGVIFNVIGPPIVAIPIPPAPGQNNQQQQQAVLPLVLGVNLPGNNPVNMPPDGTAIQTDVSDMATPQEQAAEQAMNSRAQIQTIVTQSAAWVFVSGNCQPFLAQMEDSLLFGCGGTMFAPDEEKGGLVMREGRLVTLTANKSLKVETGVGEVTIPPDSAGIVEQRPNGVFRLVSLTGGDAQVTVKNGGQTAQVAVKPGEELVVADNSIAEEDLIPVDGVDRIPVGGSIAVSGLQGKKSQYDKKQMYEREQLIHCGAGTDLVNNYKRRMAKLKQDMTGPESARGISTVPRGDMDISMVPMPVNGDAAHSKVYQKISYEKPTQVIEKHTKAIATDHGTFRFVNGAQMNFESAGVVALNGGELLICATKPTVVRCGDHLVSVDPGAIALVSNDDGLVKLCNLWEGANNAVRTYSGDKMINLSVGKQLIFGPTSQHVTRALNVDPIARRRSFYFDLPEGKGASRCEVSLVSLLQNSPVLADLVKSAAQSDQAVKEKLVKMAACLSQTTSTHGAYTTTAGSK